MNIAPTPLLSRVLKSNDTEGIIRFITGGIKTSVDMKFILLHACTKNNLDVLITLFHEIGVEKLTREVGTHKALAIACSRGHIDIVKCLFKCGVKTGGGFIPISNANRKGHYKLAYLLYQNGACLRGRGSAINPNHDHLEESKMWMAENIIGLTIEGLYACNPKEIQLFMYTLHVYCSKINLSFVDYLKDCPCWQKPHVLELMSTKA